MEPTEKEIETVALVDIEAGNTDFLSDEELSYYLSLK